jgi:hypothetical protein
MKISMVRRPSARCVNAISDSTPPSPLLSARIRNSTYLTVTTRISAHSASDSTPSTSTRETPPPAAAWARASWKA